MTSGFELCLFSHLYQEYRKALPPAESRNAAHNEISHSTRFLIDLILRGIGKSRTHGRHHYVRLTRQLILVAKTTYSKLLQDFDALDECAACTQDKQINLNDRTEVCFLYMLSSKIIN